MVRMTSKKNQKILITSALPYVNNVPHLGNIIGCVLSGDVYARFSRSMGYETLYICGTDEHGTTSEIKALEEGVTPKEICDKYYKIHKDIYDWFGCSFDAFGRTSDSENHEITVEIFNKLNDNGYILKQDVEQMYCASCDKFLADRFVEGSCPHCNYEKARGDQCDGCGKLLNSVELVEPKCKVCSSTPEVKIVPHLFMDLPKIAPELKTWIESRNENWSENSKKMTSAWLRDGLKPRGITRDLKWGVKVPMEGYTDKVFYSWFDAPIGYIGITKKHIPNWKDWWYNDSDVRLVQFMGKDNIPFHTIMFPSFLIGTKDNFTLLDYMASTEYLNYETGKFSKSNKTGVFGNDAVETGIPADVFRYYLLANRPETSDTQFSWKNFQEQNNSELLANFGNLVNRGLTFINKFFDGEVRNVELRYSDKKFLDQVDSEIKTYVELMEKIKIRDGLRQIMHISKLGNQYFQENQPWKVVKEDESECSVILYVCLELIRKLAIIIEPYLPQVSKDIFGQLNLDVQNLSNLDDSITLGHKVNVAKALFKKLEDKEINGFQEKFAGDQDSRKESNKAVEKSDSKFKNAFEKLNLKVAKIESIEPHPDADKLYVMQISVGATENGTSEKRQLVAGLRPYFSEEELLGRNVVIVSNLKPAKLRGQMSQGMLLAADCDGKVNLLNPGDAKFGDSIFIEGSTPNESQIRIDDFVKVELEVKNGNVLFEGTPLKTESGLITVDAKDGSQIR